MRPGAVSSAAEVSDVSAGRSPGQLDLFTGVIYWTRWSGDELLRTDRLGRGNTTIMLQGQTSIESVRLAHSLRYGDSTISTHRRFLALCYSTPIIELLLTLVIHLCLQCFDAVGWAAGRASGL